MCTIRWNYRKGRWKMHWLHKRGEIYQADLERWTMNENKKGFWCWPKPLVSLFCFLRWHYPDQVRWVYSQITFESPQKRFDKYSSKSVPTGKPVNNSNLPIHYFTSVRVQKLSRHITRIGSRQEKIAGCNFHRLSRSFHGCITTVLRHFLPFKTGRY